MLDAIAWLMAKEGVTAEPSGAATTAAYRKVRLKPDATYARAGTSVLLVTGCNIAPDVTALLRDRTRRDRDRPL
jgi:threonine synthase